MTDFFISYNKADRTWADWMYDRLKARYTVVSQSRDFRPGENFVLRMQEAMQSDRTIAVLSKNYLAALFTQVEWSSAFQKDPTGTQRALIPVRVEPCELPPPYNVLIYCDLVDLDEDAAAKALLDAVSPEPIVRETRAPFPGKAKAAPAFAEGTPTLEKAVRRDDRAAARLLLDTLESTYATFVAQSRVRDELRDAMVKRFPAGVGLEYEEFFSRYFNEMTADERKLHDMMRGYTVTAMYEYNKQALALVRDHAGLATQVPKLAALRHHLEVWMDKYTNKFLSSPHMALCYVGVEEGVPFPHGIEDDLRGYLDASSPDALRSGG